MAVDFGRYQLLKKIAAGGMGQVFLARTAGTGGFEKLLVIKRILPQLVEDDEFIEMFFDEARIAARLNHPNLVQIFDLGEAENSHYLAMEYVAGEDLRRVDKRSRASGAPMPVPLVLRVIADAAAGLDYAHKARDSHGQPLNLVHRDVSPQNILVGFDGAVKLIDFGVAKAAGRMQLTASGILKGKYPYMSPEQADGLELDGRSDLFALGIVCWELLTHLRLFKGDSDLQTLRLVKDCLVKPPSELNPEVPKALDAILLKALARDPTQRHKDAGEFRLELENFLISHSMPASSAHLSAFMQGLYRDRIELEADPGMLDELAPDAGLEPGSTPVSRSRSAAPDKVASARISRTSERNVPSVASRAQSTRERKVLSGTQALPPPARMSAQKLAAIIAAGVFIIGAGVAVPLLLRGGSPEPLPTALPTPSQTKVTQVHIVDTNTQAPPATDILVQLRSDPAGAIVDVGGRKLGPTPVALAVPADGTRVVARVSMDGFEPQDAMLSRSDAPELVVQLQKKHIAAQHATTTRKPPLGIKTGR